MTHQLTRQVKQAPAHGCHFVALPVSAQDRTLEQNEQVMGDHADTEEGGIGCQLPARHTLHTKADLQFLDAIFGYFAPLAIPNQRGLCGFNAIAGDDVIFGRIIKQFGLAFVFDDDD